MAEVTAGVRQVIPFPHNIMFRCSVENKSQTYITFRSGTSHSSERDWPKSSDTRPLLPTRIISPAG